MNRRQKASQQLRALWMNPEFRAKRTQEASDRMKLNWQRPSFRDKQWRASVKNWAKPSYRQRQYAAILKKQRPLPLARQPTGTPCMEANCQRLDTHSFHVAVLGTMEEGNLTLTGWESSAMPANAASRATSLHPTQ